MALFYCPSKLQKTTLLVILSNMVYYLCNKHLEIILNISNEHLNNLPKCSS
ncbi:hypothetical protein TOT_040000875 [Theileria orientalis strain Shintoku]|uniref:Uncharacterized protein n=1 Tax=Theileria orientalis strain Shintoku TaxID=869250 RepID=J7MCH0_THEOR|nr:hypothetical protein TOT_040000875 [Theileria orientalis strain Shintoku]PVC49834.1 hypothetical protein MACL_00002704 [Theileria orientalis]BAM42507.1 hypothetical protein TOT_040000875 [Theileria orientalis strain Shintoku]|eukprot:XP_009692808.1 hypothetical protein TOT_040000875 [Theileria orientalis strain Shintoku]